MVLSPKGEDKYEMKYVPEDFDRYDQGFFGRAKPEYIKGILTEYAKYYTKMSKDYSFLKPIIISDIMR